MTNRGVCHSDIFRICAYQIKNIQVVGELTLTTMREALFNNS